MNVFQAFLLQPAEKSLEYPRFFHLDTVDDFLAAQTDGVDEGKLLIGRLALVDEREKEGDAASAADSRPELGDESEIEERRQGELRHHFLLTGGEFYQLGKYVG